MYYKIAQYIRLATEKDVFHKSQCTCWTLESDGLLVELLSNGSYAQAARVLGKPLERVRERAKQLKLSPVPEYDRNTPSLAEWKQIATTEARKARVRPEDVLGKLRTRKVVQARWKAWKVLLEKDPNYSAKGLSRVVGSNHTTILDGLNRLREILAAE